MKKEIIYCGLVFVSFLVIYFLSQFFTGVILEKINIEYHEVVQFIFFILSLSIGFIFSSWMLYLRYNNRKKERIFFLGGNPYRGFTTAKETEENFYMLNWGDSWKDFFDFKAWAIKIKKFIRE